MKKQPEASEEVIGQFELGETFPCVCGERHGFGTYVAAHWNESLTHTCQKCGAQHEVHAGRVTLLSKGGQS